MPVPWTLGDGNLFLPNMMLSEFRFSVLGSISFSDSTSVFSGVGQLMVVGSHVCAQISPKQKYTPQPHTKSLNTNQ